MFSGPWPWDKPDNSDIRLAIGFDDSDTAILRVDSGPAGMAILDIELDVAEQLDFRRIVDRRGINGWGFSLGGY